MGVVLGVPVTFHGLDGRYSRLALVGSITKLWLEDRAKFAHGALAEPGEACVVTLLTSCQHHPCWQSLAR